MKKCPKCGEMLGDKANTCFKCGYEYNNEKDLLKIKALNELYEYKVVSLSDNSAGMINTNNLSTVLNMYASNGWRLKNVITNEIGKNAMSIGYAGISGGSNATIEMTILIFERKVKGFDEIEDEIQDEISFIEETVQNQIEENERRRAKIPNSLNKIEEEILDVFEEHGQIITLTNISSALNDRYSIMDLLTYLQRLVDAGKLEKDANNYKLI